MPSSAAQPDVSNDGDGDGGGGGDGGEDADEGSEGAAQELTKLVLVVVSV